MKNRLFSPGESYTVATNLERIEEVLGHSVPAGLIDPAEISEYLLSNGEISTIVQNISTIERTRKDHSNINYHVEPFSFILALKSIFSPRSQELAECVSSGKGVTYYAARFLFFLIKLIVATASITVLFCILGFFIN